METAKVENEPDLARDKKTGAVLNTNMTALQAYKTRKREARRINNVEERLDGIENMLSLILERLPK